MLVLLLLLLLLLFFILTVPFTLEESSLDILCQFIYCSCKGALTPSLFGVFVSEPDALKVFSLISICFGMCEHNNCT